MPHSASTQVKDPWIRNLYRTHPGLTLHRPPSPTLPEPWLMLLSESQTRPIDRGSPPRVTHPCFSTYSPRAQDVTDSRPFFFFPFLYLFGLNVCVRGSACASAHGREVREFLGVNSRLPPGGLREGIQSQLSRLRCRKLLMAEFHVPALAFPALIQAL